MINIISKRSHYSSRLSNERTKLSMSTKYIPCTHKLITAIYLTHMICKVTKVFDAKLVKLFTLSTSESLEQLAGSCN